MTYPYPPGGPTTADRLLRGAIDLHHHGYPGVSFEQKMRLTDVDELNVKWGQDVASGRFAMRVVAPQSTSGTIAVPTAGHPVSVTVNGRVVWRNGAAVAGTVKAAAAGDYIDLTVSGGTYDISTTVG